MPSTTRKWSELTTEEQTEVKIEWNNVKWKMTMGSILGDVTRSNALWRKNNKNKWVPRLWV